MPTPQLPFAAAVRKAENNGVIFDCGTPTVIAGCSNKNIREIIIPDGVTAIGGSAFANCSQLTSVTIPGSVITIGHETFSGCSNLTEVLLAPELPPLTGRLSPIVPL